MINLQQFAVQLLLKQQAIELGNFVVGDVLVANQRTFDASFVRCLVVAHFFLYGLTFFLRVDFGLGLRLLLACEVLFTQIGSKAFPCLRFGCV